MKIFPTAFEDYWKTTRRSVSVRQTSVEWHDLGLEGDQRARGIFAALATNALLQTIADDIARRPLKPLLLAGISLSDPRTHQKAIKKITENDKIFVYGISDRKVGGIQLHKPDGNVSPVEPTVLGKNVPEPFKSEPTGGGGTRMHHKFVVIDFDKPTARVYFGSYNFSRAGRSQEWRKPAAHP